MIGNWWRVAVRMLTHGGSVEAPGNGRGGLIRRAVTAEPPCVSMRTGARYRFANREIPALTDGVITTGISLRILWAVFT